MILDVNAPREVIEEAEEVEPDTMFNMDETIVADKLKHPVAHTLDVLMDKITNYIIMECHDVKTGAINWENTKGLIFLIKIRK